MPSAPPWLPVFAAHLPLAVDRQAADAQSMLAYSRALIHWRRTQPLLRTGALRSGNLAFQIAPRINAGGRVGSAERAFSLLTAATPSDT